MQLQLLIIFYQSIIITLLLCGKSDSSTNLKSSNPNSTALNSVIQTTQSTNQQISSSKISNLIRLNRS